MRWLVEALPAAAVTTLYLVAATMLFLNPAHLIDIRFIASDLAELLFQYPLVSLIILFSLTMLGSFVDGMLMQDGLRRKPILAIILSIVVLAVSLFGYGIFLARSQYDINHPQFYVGVLVNILLAYIVWVWARSRIWLRVRHYPKKTR